MRTIPRTSLIAAAALIWSIAAAPAALPRPTPRATPVPAGRALSLANKPWTGDFDGMVKRRQLNQDEKSPVGAIGIMQVMPATGKELAVGDITVIEPNIHAGTKYMDQLMTRYFADAHFSPEARPLFAFASYNAGPGNISKMRKEAARRGLDPDQWFNNVEIVVAERIGIETTTYVRNIYKYYSAYRLSLAAVEAQEKARRKVAPGAK